MAWRLVESVIVVVVIAAVVLVMSWVKVETTDPAGTNVRMTTTCSTWMSGQGGGQMCVHDSQ